MESELGDPAAEIRAHRARLDMTQEQAALALGISTGTLRKWEEGQLGHLRVYEVVRLARWLEVGPADLLVAIVRHTTTTGA